MAMWSGARKAIIWGGGALAGVGLLVASFFAGTAVGDNAEFEQAGTAQEQDAGDSEGRDLFDQQDERNDQDEQDAKDGENRDDDGEAGDRRGGGDAEDRDAEDRGAEEPGKTEGRDGLGPEGHHGRGHHDNDGHHGGGPDEDLEADSESGDGTGPA